MSLHLTDCSTCLIYGRFHLPVQSQTCHRNLAIGWDWAAIVIARGPRSTLRLLRRFQIDLLCQCSCFCHHHRHFCLFERFHQSSCYLRLGCYLSLSVGCFDCFLSENLWCSAVAYYCPHHSNFAHRAARRHLNYWNRLAVWSFRHAFSSNPFHREFFGHIDCYGGRHGYLDKNSGVERPFAVREGLPSLSCGDSWVTVLRRL